jgi:hypothetical protein
MTSSAGCLFDVGSLPQLTRLLIKTILPAIGRKEEEVSRDLPITGVCVSS